MQSDISSEVSPSSPLEFSDSPQGELFLPKRRELIRLMGVGGSLAALGPLAGCGSDSNAQPVPSTADALRATLTQDTPFWTSVRGRFILDPAVTFMNVGTSGSMPQSVLDFYAEQSRAAAVSAPGGYGNLLAERTAVANGLGADPDELVFSYNTSDGMSKSILGLDWKAGDVVVTTNHEHGGGNNPLAIAVDRYGIEVQRVPLPTGDNQTAQQYFDLFDQAVTTLKGQGKNVRAMMWSSPTYLTGTMLPIPQLMEVVKKHGLISIVDGAHLPGMMAYDYRQFGMDFMSAAGHKWQCGPGSTGIWFVRNKIRASNPLPLPKFWPVSSSSFSPAPPAWHTRATSVGQEPTYNIGNALQSIGSLNLPMFRALVESCKIWDEIGRKRIEDYVLNLSLYLKERIVERWGVDRLYSPRNRDLLSALTSFNPFENPADVTTAKSGQFVTRMQQKGFVVRNTSVPIIGQTTNHQPIRISTHLFHNADDVDRLVAAMWETRNELR